jgi:hypothetical protein
MQKRNGEHQISQLRLRHPRAGGDPVIFNWFWTPACAGMTFLWTTEKSVPESTLYSKLPIDGLKLSQALAQINLPGTGKPRVLDAFHRLAVRRINLSLVTLDAIDGRWSGSCCISMEDLASAKQELVGLQDGIEYLSPVGTLTLFPHRSRLDLLKSILAVFAQDGLPVHGIASATSTLTITTDFECLAEATAAVQRIVDLPANHAPIHTQFQVKQV